jgi:ribosome-binding ATPase YchF (GTP1/OBG family)
MKTKILLCALLGMFSCNLHAEPQAAAGPSAAEIKMREELKTSRLQLRTMQTERDTAMSEKQALEAELKKLKSDVEKRIKDEEEFKKNNEKNLSELNSKLGDTEKNLGQTQEALTKWKDSHAKVVAIANSTESKRVQLASQTVMMQRRIDEQQTRNREMYKLAEEILQRYEKFGLGTALLAREPFTGIAKVKLQTWVQDFSDKLTDAQIGPNTVKGDKPVSTPYPAASSPTAAQAAPAAGGAKPAKTETKATR